MEGSVRMLEEVSVLVMEREERHWEGRVQYIGMLEGRALVWDGVYKESERNS